MSTNETQVVNPPPSPRTVFPPLRRSTSDRMIGGVCGGIARRYGIDPVVVRVVFVVALIAAGVGGLAYLALWMLLPADTDPWPDPLTRNVLGLIFGVVFALAAVGAALGWLGSLGGLTGVIVGAFLVGLVVWLYQRRDTTAGLAPGQMPAGPAGTTDWGAPATPATPEGSWTPPTGFAYGGTGQPQPQQLPVYRPAPPRPRSYLGLITVLAAVVVGAALSTLAAAGLWSLGPVAVMAAMLAVLAAGLLVSAFAGRARWLIFLALPLALLVGVTAQVASVLPITVPAGVGERTWTPTEPGEFRLGVGESTLDLTAWAGRPAAAQPDGQTVTAEIGIGQLNVVVPDNWQVDATARTGAGTISLNGDRVQADPGESVALALPATGEATGRLRLLLSADVGDIVITRQPARALPAAPAATPTPGASKDSRESPTGGSKAQDQRSNTNDQENGR